MEDNKKLDLPEMITAKDMQKHLGLNKDTIYKLISMESFPKITIGKKYLIPKAKYLKWLDDNLYKTIYLK